MSNLIDHVSNLKHAAQRASPTYPYLAVNFYRWTRAERTDGVPVRNKWVITFGLIACAGVIPLALIAGQVRGISLGWRFIDCSFGVFGSVPLLICRHYINKLEQ